MITVFIAAIVVPSLLRSDTATNKALAAGALHTIHIASTTFSYTDQNVGFAMFGALVGASAALAIHYYVYVPTPQNKISKCMITLRAALLRL
jgi:hypothetical protein